MTWPFVPPERASDTVQWVEIGETSPNSRTVVSNAEATHRARRSGVPKGLKRSTV
jgi:hypothetical protein